MRKVIPVVAMLVLIVTLSTTGVSCGPSAPTQLLTYTDEANGFSISYPQDWNIAYPDRPTIKVCIQSKTLTGYNAAYIIVAKEHYYGSLESYSERRIRFLSENSETYAPIATGELTIDGVQAKKHTFAESLGETPYTSIQVYLVQDGTGWVLGFSCPQKSFNTYEAASGAIINSFHLLKQQSK